MRGEKKYEKLNEAHDEWMKQQKTGEGYQPGIAVAIALAKKNLPNPADRNPKGTPKEKWRFLWCTGTQGCPVKGVRNECKEQSGKRSCQKKHAS